MIFTDRKITIRNGKSSINEPVILYRGDYEVSIKFTIMESKFRFKSGVNLVDSEKASHGQLAILAPYGGNVFSKVVKCEDGTVTFTLTKEMIDQLEEVGLYSFQIRLFDYYRESRVSIPPVEFGIEVREPVASEDHDNEVNNAIVGYSIAKVVDGLNEDVPDTFNSNGQYNKTDWETGDRITEGKLNKIEEAIDTINQNEKNDVAALDKRVTNNFNVLDANKANKNEIFSMKNMGQDVKEAMTGGSVPVVGINAVLTDNVADRQITSIKLANDMGYYNADDGEYGQIIDNGTVTSNIRIWSSNFIPVEPGSSYLIQCFFNGNDKLPFCTYDKNMQYLNRVMIDKNCVWVYNPPENVGFIRISMMTEDKGSFKVTPLGHLAIPIVNGEGLLDNSVRLSALAFVDGECVDYLTYNTEIKNGVYTNIDGSQTDFPELYTTGFIAVKGGRTYYTRKKEKITPNKTICLYDANKRCLNLAVGTQRSINGVTMVELPIPSSCAYVKFNGNQSTRDLDFLVDDIDKIDKVGNPIRFHNIVSLNDTQRREAYTEAEKYALTNLIDESSNLFNDSNPDWEAGCYYNDPGYVYTPHEKLSISGYIPVSAGQCYAVSEMAAIMSTKMGWFYNASRAYTNKIVETVNFGDYRIIEIPNNAFYMRLHYNNTQTGKTAFKLEEINIDKSDTNYELGCFYNASHVHTEDIALDTSGYISVKPGDQFMITKMINVPESDLGWFYDSDHQPVGQIISNASYTYNWQIVAPDNAAYMRVHVDKSVDCIIQKLPNGNMYEPPGFILKDRVTVKNLDIEANKFRGKIFNFMGDSITAGTGTTKTYWKYMAEDLGIVANGYGISGSRIADGSNPMHSRVLNMSADADYIFVFGGTNDFNSDTTLGELYTTDSNGKKVATSATNTFYGALHTMCVNLINRYPDKKIVLMTPIHREVFGTQHLDTEPNDKGNYLTEYVNAIKEVGEWYSIPVLDLYATSGMNPNIPIHKELYFSPDDGLHPKAEGHRRIADRIIAFLNTI